MRFPSLVNSVMRAAGDVAGIAENSLPSWSRIMMEWGVRFMNCTEFSLSAIRLEPACLLIADLLGQHDGAGRYGVALEALECC